MRKDAAKRIDGLKSKRKQTTIVPRSVMFSTPSLIVDVREIPPKLTRRMSNDW